MPRASGPIPLLVALLTAITLSSGTAVAAELRLRDLNGRVVDPFSLPPNTRAFVFVFVSTDCPISNRYAPQVRQLFEAFRSQRVAIWLIDPDPRESADASREHLQAFALPERALRDPEHALADAAQITVTPEAAVYDGHRQLAYRGRIDDRYVSLGLERPTATRADLSEAVAAVVAGTRVAVPRTHAVGCFIRDFTDR